MQTPAVVSDLSVFFASNLTTTPPRLLSFLHIRFYTVTKLYEAIRLFKKEKQPQINWPIILVCN